MSESKNILEIRNLKTSFFTESGEVSAVNDVTFDVKEGETLAVVGESGSGKSVTAFSIMDLVKPPGKIVGGEINFKGQNLINASPKKIRQIRGNEISMIFQEPLTSLNPLFTVGNQINETITLHQKVSKQEAKKRSIEMLKQVGIPHPERVYGSFPHLLSGGMRQRVMIAMALSCNPNLLIADEPTTALDVTIQTQILKLMKNLRDKNNNSIIFITHDLGVVAEVADRVIVMYAGEVLEINDVFEIFNNPKHPYTESLLNSTPKMSDEKEILPSIKGNVPNPLEMPTGCKFHPRCPYVMEKCVSSNPDLINIGDDQQVRCWLHEKKEV